MLDTIAYPEFVPNQILTDRQLNQLRSHLEQQDRLTRIRLTGAGIVCGLHIRRVTDPPGVAVTAGYGIASDGDLIELCDTTTYTHLLKPYVDPDRDEDGKLRYLPWRDPTDADHKKQIDIFELIPPEVMQGKNPPAAQAFTAATLTSALADRAVVLYLEHQPVDLNSCLVTSCDNKGRNINVHVRALLVPRIRLTQAAECPTPRPLYRVPRLHTRGVPQPVTTATQIRSAFSDLVAAHAGAVGNNIKALFDTYAAFLNLSPIAQDPLGTNGSKLTGSQIAEYRYDALLDIATAYNEAAAAAYSLITECCPASTFPRHLMLGVLDGSPAGRFRNELTPSSGRNVIGGEIDRVRDLFRRLEAMTVLVNLDAHPGPVSIAPSHAAGYPLGRRARPFYFSALNLASLWRPRPRCSVDPDWPWEHPSTARSLATDYAEITFLRIEGHVGDAGDAARTAIITKRDEANAEFQVLCSYIEDDAAEERDARSALAKLLETPEETLAAAWDAFAKWVVDGDESFDAVIELSQLQQERLEDLAETSKGWIDLRNRRQLHCDASPLAHDYLEARSELLCLVSRARGIAGRVRQDAKALDDKSLTGPGLAAMLEGAPFALVDHLVAAVMASPADWDTPEEIGNQLESAQDVEGPQALRLALDFALRNLDASLRRLAELAAPRRISEFDYDLFAWCVRDAVAKSRELWHWMRALGVAVPGAPFQGDNEGDAPLHRAEAAALAGDWLALHGCLLARFATLSAAYESVRARDLSLFRNLAAIDGLEHLGGVSKGGTFILVCDRAAPGGSVVADFSLEGRLPCCCGFDAEPVCLPPLALPDVRVITLSSTDGGKTYAQLTMLIDVVGNDCDLNGLPAEMKLTDAAERSERGVPLDVDAEAGVITYTTPQSARPGMVDRFWYRLQQTGRCKDATIGHVIIIFAVEPLVDGRIEGFVWREDTEGRGDDAIVTIIETGQELMTSGSGDFVFEAIRAGQYSLKARQDNMVSDPVAAAVVGGQTTHVEIMLKKPADQPTTGTILVRVRDVTGASLPGVTVRVTHRETGLVRTAATNTAGVAVFEALPAGVYVGVVLAPGHPGVPFGTLTLAAGQTLTEEVVLGTEKPVIPSGAAVFVADARDMNVLEANATLRNTVLDRYAKYVDAINTSTTDARILTSDAYVAGTVFLGEKLTDPEVTDEALAEEFSKTSTALAAAASEATGDEKAAYQAALTSVTAAYMDRVALSNPQALPPERTEELQAAVKTVKDAGVAAEDVRTMWDAAALRTSTGVRSADSINRLIR